MNAISYPQSCLLKNVMGRKQSSYLKNGIWKKTKFLIEKWDGEENKVPNWKMGFGRHQNSYLKNGMGKKIKFLIEKWDWEENKVPNWKMGWGRKQSS